MLSAAKNMDAASRLFPFVNSPLVLPLTKDLDKICLILTQDLFID